MRFSANRNATPQLSESFAMPQSTSSSPSVGASANAPQRVVDAMRRRLNTGEYAAGSRLPALRKLAGEFNVSLGAVHTAIGRLEHEGLVHARHGSGVYVADKPTQPQTFVLVSRVTGHHWSELANAFIQHFSSRGDTRLLIEDVPSKDDDEQGIARLEAFRDKLQKLMEEGVTAAIINGSNEAGAEQVIDYLPPEMPRLGFFSKDGLSKSAAAGNIGGVWTDWHHGGYAGCRHLIEGGCRNIGILTPHGNVGGSSRSVYSGCELAVADSAHTVTLTPLACSMEHEGRDARLRKLFEAHPKLDGLYAFSDYAAACSMAVLQQLGRRVPDDVAVLGYYDTPWCEAVSPSLSSISTCTNQIVSATISLLDTGKFNEQITVHPKLVIRESTRRG